MSGEKETRQMPAAQREGSASPGWQNDGDEAGHPHGVQAQRDEEIAAMQEHSRHQPPAIQPPPELPPAPPRKALMIVGVALLVLLVAGAVTLIGHESHERALAKETERQTVPDSRSGSTPGREAGRGTGAARLVAGFRRISHLRPH
jgi:hypothetical protein